MIHRAVTIKPGKAGRVQGVIVVQKEKPQEELWKPPTPSGEPHSCVPPQSSQSCLSLAIPTPTPSPLSQSLLFPIRINHPILCLLCKPPPAPTLALSIQCPAWMLQLPPPDWGPLQGRNEWRKGLHFYLRPAGPIPQPASRGTGAPQLPP